MTWGRHPGGCRGREKARRPLPGSGSALPEARGRRPRGASIEGLPAGPVSGPSFSPQPPRQPPTGPTRQNLPPPPSPPPAPGPTPAAPTAVSHSSECTYPPHTAPLSPWYGPCYRPLVDVPLRIGRLRRGLRPGPAPPDDTLIPPTYGRSCKSAGRQRGTMDNRRRPAGRGPPPLRPPPNPGASG